MKANPGGQLTPGEVIGRDRLIRKLWRVLETRSLVLSAERRMGKTSVIKKMTAEASPSKLPIKSKN
jgi:ATP/maltotriose-dependent transcriptional regulator MalT